MNGLSLDYADLLAQCRNRQNKFMIIHEYTSLEPICGQKWSNSWSSTFMHFEQRLNYKFNFKCMFNDFQDFQGFQDYGHINVCQCVRESVTVSPVLSHRRLKINQTHG